MLHSGKQKTRRTPSTLYIIGLLILLTTNLYAGGLNGINEGDAIPTAQEAEILAIMNALEVMQKANRAVAKDVLPVIVEIDVTDVVRQRFPEMQSPFEFFFGPKEEGESREREFRRFGLGSGVVVKRSGQKVYVLTNNHVVGAADEITVTLYDKRQFNATLVGKDPRKDLALIEFETEEEVPVAVLGNSDNVEVGDIVFAVGNPLGFESTITSGIVSAVGRRPPGGVQVSGFTDYIQTDAAINRGNSGGALVNIKGEVIGINSWISSPNGGNIGLGFSIPINNAKQAIEDFISKGSVDYGWLGINVADVSPELKSDMRIEDQSGAFVYDVFMSSPADKAGILPGDYVIRINGVKVEDSTSLVLTVGGLPVGKSARFDLIRYGEAMMVEVKISSRQDEAAIREQRKYLWPGMAVMKITPEIQKQLDLPKRMGDLVIGNIAPEGPTGLAGFRPGDVISSINGDSTETVMDFYRAMNNVDTHELVFRIYRKGSEMIIGLIRK
jgi:serine protease Do